MFTMQAFHKMLSTTSKGRDRRLDTLVAITKADRDQLSELSSELAWQTWSAPTLEA
jgi:hypothetical protein